MREDIPPQSTIAEVWVNDVIITIMPSKSIAPPIRSRAETRGTRQTLSGRRFGSPLLSDPRETASHFAATHERPCRSRTHRIQERMVDNVRQGGNLLRHMGPTGQDTYDDGADHWHCRTATRRHDPRALADTVTFEQQDRWQTMMA